MANLTTMLRFSSSTLRSFTRVSTPSSSRIHGSFGNPSYRSTCFYKNSKFPTPATAHFPSPRPYVLCSSRALDDAFARWSMHSGGDGVGGNSGTGGAGGDGQNGDPGGGGGGGGGGDESVPHSLLAWYLMLLNRYPVSTKAVTAALITFIGDLFCQLVIEKSGEVDVKRICTFTLLGLILVGPTLHFWYLTLNKWISGSGPVKAGVRLALDQFMFAPLFIGVFFSALLSLEGRPSDIIPKLHQDWATSVLMNWKIWIPFQFLNFLVVPQQLQVLAANVISLAWNIYLSFTTHTLVVPPSEEKLASDVQPKI